MMLSLKLMMALLASAPSVSGDGVDAALLFSPSKDYVAARNQLLKRPKSLAAIRTLAATQPTESNWQAVVFSKVMRAHADSPEWAAKLARPVDLVPEHYLKNRVKRPVPYRSLRRTPSAAIPFLYELWFKADQLEVFSKQKDFPSHVAASERADLQLQEKSRLRHSILSVLGERGGAEAVFFLESVQAESSNELGFRKTALVALSVTRSERGFAVLRNVASSSAVSELKESALVGLGRAGDSASRAVLLAALRPESSVRLHMASLRSMERSLRSQPAPWLDNARIIDLLVNLVASDSSHAISAATSVLAIIVQQHPQATRTRWLEKEGAAEPLRRAEQLVRFRERRRTNGRPSVR